MQPTRIIADDEAVSPVIGVILMVAITVILASVIAAFVLGVDIADDGAPTTNFAFDYEDDPASTQDALTIVHDGGDTVDPGRLQLKTDGTPISGTDGNPGSTEMAFTSNTDATSGSQLTSGDSVDVFAGSGEELNAATVRIVWRSSGSDSSSTLATWEGPDA